jgi:DEAD/DEAH box helicase domain-containing protein
MIPSIVAANLETGLKDYLRTTFPIHSPFFKDLFEDFFAAKGDLFKGPYLSIQLPFRQGSLDPDFFQAIHLPYPPYEHQVTAFRRLTGDQPRSTLVATGTGSGKTESFLYPILEHCWRERDRRGVKAILIYPMNALATDQAKRLAREIDRSDELRGTIRAGLYVGGDDKAQHRTMGPDHLITHREVLRQDPPDILLTNYKMLDLLMVRPKDSQLWHQNELDTLRFVVVDELHTFDGAQGTDLACLLRRLKARLGTPKGGLCCVGTSATLGGGEAKKDLLTYARRVFGEPFEPDAIVGETRQDPDEFLRNHPATNDQLPDPEALRALLSDPSLPRDAMARELARLFFPDRDWSGETWQLDLRAPLKHHALFQAMIKVLRGATIELETLRGALANLVPGFGQDEQADRDRLDALVALAAAAREPGDRPFVQLRIQKWLREMRRMVATLTPRPQLRFHADLTAREADSHLPLVHCRDCGAMGWAGFKPEQESGVSSSLEDFYRAYFDADPRIAYLFPRTAQDAPPGPEWPAGLVCDRCLTITSREDAERCPCTGNWLPIYHGVITEVKRGRRVGSHVCPICDSDGGLSILGARAATMTSTLIDQLFASPLNDDKKLLTFSDSVQDASHRAAFFAGRTYNVTLRTALFQVLDEHPNLPMSRMAETFQRVMLARMDHPTFVATFLPSDLYWLQENEAMKQTGQVSQEGTLWRFLGQRLEWEVLREFGVRSQVGRTLERNGLAIAQVDLAAVDRVAAWMVTAWTAEFGDTFQELPHEAARRFLLGALRQMRVMGAIANPIFEPQLLPHFSGFLFRRQRFLPPMGRNSHAPTFFATFEHRSDGFELFAKPNGRGTWLQAWTERTLVNPAATLHRVGVDQALVMLWPMLQREGLIRTYQDGKRGTAWALDPDRFTVTREVARMRCRSCGQTISVPSPEAPDWKDSGCLRRDCRGTYEAAPLDHPYFARLYRDGDLARLFPAEHTGLLERHVREEVETSFMRKVGDRRPWDPNLLSCTPTLEMGIDIGDLSTVALCSVPPAQANYLQRVGRAGRRDGNALTLTVANGEPHDLYFYAEPLEMMAGQVRPPGVFLDAAMVLERQLAAFAFDQWVKGGLSVGAIPDRVGLALSNLGKQAPARFPQNFLRYVADHREALLAGFEALFDPDELTSPSRTHLRGFLQVSGAPHTVAARLTAGLTRLQQRIESYQRTVRRLQDQISREEANPAQDDTTKKRLLEMKGEDAGLRALIIDLKHRDLFGFLTDEGLLPNYAFPEPGVTLNSIIFWKKEEGEGSGHFQRKVYSYERPASSALGELAPASHFYAEGRKVMVDQVDLSQSELETWRFCPDCHHAEHERQPTMSSAPACPRCGSTMWPDTGQVRTLIRMREVVATTSDRDSRATDDSDDRTIKFFERSLLVDVDPQDVIKAFQLKSNKAFGVEFLRRARFRDMNLGAKTFDSPEWRFAGKSVRPRGFALCRHCGKVQTGEDEIKHAYSCKARDKETLENRLEVAYLYREFESEALRLLLPFVTETQDDPRLASFIAAMHLGLQRYFGGSIDHLRLTQMDEPIPDSALRRRYLVLMDTVPGGTGYLKQLYLKEGSSGPEVLMDVLQLALDHLKACSCALDDRKDGCYRCVFRYRNSREMDRISRTQAITELSAVLKSRNDWEPVDTVASISTNPLVDSKLEELFVKALHRIARVQDDLSRGRNGYRVTVGSRRYRLDLQVPIGPEEGIRVPMKADFVFHPEGQDGVRPIVVFTDGFSFHKDRLSLDFAQRQALWQSGRYHCFALGYQDIMAALAEPVSVQAVNLLDPQALPLASVADQVLSGMNASALKGMLGVSAFDQLRQFLVEPDASAWGGLAFAWSLLTASRSDPDGSAWRESTRPFLDLPSPEAFRSPEPHVHGSIARDGLRVWIRVPQARTRQPHPEAVWAALRLEDGGDRPQFPSFVSEWLGTLRACNLLQFLPQFQAIASDGLLTEFPAMPAAEELPDDYRFTLQLTDPAWEPCLRALAAEGVPCPEVGYELFIEKRVVGNCDLGWPERKVAVFGPETAAMVGEFERHGWHVTVLEAVAAASTHVEEWKAHVAAT